MDATTDTRQYLTAKAAVYRFAGGPVWHWKCDNGRCLGGRSRQHQSALDAAVAHVVAEHIYELATVSTVTIDTSTEDSTDG